MSRIRGTYVVAIVPLVLGIALHLYEHVALSDNALRRDKCRFAL